MNTKQPANQARVALHVDGVSKIDVTDRQAASDTDVLWWKFMQPYEDAGTRYSEVFEFGDEQAV